MSEIYRSNGCMPQFLVTTLLLLGASSAGIAAIQDKYNQGDDLTTYHVGNGQFIIFQDGKPFIYRTEDPDKLYYSLNFEDGSTIEIGAFDDPAFPESAIAVPSIYINTQEGNIYIPQARLMAQTDQFIYYQPLNKEETGKIFRLDKLSGEKIQVLDINTFSYLFKDKLNTEEATQMRFSGLSVNPKGEMAVGVLFSTQDKTDHRILVSDGKEYTEYFNSESHRGTQKGNIKFAFSDDRNLAITIPNSSGTNLLILDTKRDQNTQRLNTNLNAIAKGIMFTEDEILVIHVNDTQSNPANQLWVGEIADFQLPIQRDFQVVTLPEEEFGASVWNQ